MGAPVRPGLVAPWRLSSREKRFAVALLTRRTNLWLFRTDQKRRAGDFVVVDMSSPDPVRRRVWVVDLKCGAELKVGGGGAGMQLLNAPLAVEAVAGLSSSPPVLAVGDGVVLLEALGV